MNATESDIRNAHFAGLRHRNTEIWWNYYTGVLQVAYDAGQAGYQLSDAVENCERYGSLPQNGCSHNYSDDRSECGVSVIKCGDDDNGSAGAHMFMRARGIVTFSGIKIIDVTGSDGEPMVLPVDFYENCE